MNAYVPLTRRQALSVIAIQGPTPGICKSCGCSHFNPCILAIAPGRHRNRRGPEPGYTTCGWTDATQTVCTNPACAEQAVVASERT